MNRKRCVVAVGVLSIACLSAGDALARGGGGGGRGGTSGGAGMGRGASANQAARMQRAMPYQGGGGQFGVMLQQRLRDGSCVGKSGRQTAGGVDQQNVSGQQAGPQNRLGNQMRMMQQQRLRDGSGQGQATSDGKGRGHGQGWKGGNGSQR